MRTQIIKKILAVLVLATVLLSSMGLAEGTGSTLNLAGLDAIMDQQAEEIGSTLNLGGIDGLLDAVDEENEKERITELESERKMPFDGGVLSEALQASGGKCSLVALHHNLTHDLVKERYFSLWQFPQLSDSELESLVAANEARYFECSREEFEGEECIKLKQFGLQELQVWILPNHRERLLLFIEEGLETVGLPESIPSLYIFCTRCTGDGKCHADYCNGGKCKECYGTGYSVCVICQGTDHCKHCGGTGMRISGDYIRQCSRCYGTGKCTYCEGEGHTSRACWRCENGVCKTCNGTNECRTCGGDGNLAQ